MAWLRIDDAFTDHPKIVALGTPDRRWTWVRLLVYSCKHRTAVIPNGIADVIPKATVSYLTACVRIGLIDVDEHGTMRIHDWDEYQAGDPKKAARQRRWRHSVDADVDADVDAPVDDDVDADVDERVDASRVGARARTRPVPSPTNKEPAPAPEPVANKDEPDGAGAGQEIDEPNFPEPRRVSQEIIDQLEAARLKAKTKR